MGSVQLLRSGYRLCSGAIDFLNASADTSGGRARDHVLAYMRTSSWSGKSKTC